METYKINDREYNCPLILVQSMIMSKWKGRIIWALIQHKKLRYGQLRAGIQELIPVTDKMLIQSLKELEADGIVVRHDYNTVPPHVDYALTKRGQELAPIWRQLWKFGEQYKV